MTVTVTKSEINVRDTLTRLDAPQGVFGNQLAATNTVTEAYTLMNPVMFRNKIINGDFRVWQRGTSITTTGAQYTADQWVIEPRSSQSTTITQSTDVPTNGGFTYSGRFTATGGSLQGFHFRQGLELPSTGTYGEFQPGTTWTLSLWAKSAYTGVAISPQLFLCGSVTGGSNTSVAIVPGAQTIGQSWSKYTWTITIPTYVVDSGSLSSATVFLIRFIVGAGAQDLFVTGVQFEKNSQATPFEFRPFSTELALCQRYYYRLWSGGNPSLFAIGASAGSDSSVMWYIQLPVPMRVSPACSSSGATTLGTWPMGTGGSNILGSSFYSLGGTSAYPYQHIEVMLILASSPGTQVSRVGFKANAGVGYIDASAEL